MKRAHGAALAAVVVGSALLLSVEGAALSDAWLPLREAAALQHARGGGDAGAVGSLLYAPVLAPAARLLSAADAYRFATVLSALLWALTAVPAYLLARRLVTSTAALVVAALAVVVPASIYATAAVPEALGQLLAVSSLALLLRAAERGDRRELVGALALGTAAALAAPWLVTLPPALLVAYELPRRDPRSFLRWPRSLVFGGYAVLAYFLLLRLAPDAGSAFARPEDVARAAAAGLAVVVVGTAVVPWLLVAAADRPSAWRTETALLAACTVALVVSAGAFGAAGSGVDERPLLVLVPLVLALAAEAWLGGRVRPRNAAIAAVVFALMAFALPRLGRVPAAYAAGLSVVAPRGASGAVLGGGVAAAVAVALGLALLLRRRRIVVPAIVAAVLLFGQAEAWSSARAEARSLARDDVPHGWIDRAAGRDEHVLAVGPAGTFDAATLAQLTLWNRSFRGVRVLDPSQGDSRTGLVPGSYGPIVLARELDLVGPRLGLSPVGALVRVGSRVQLADAVEGRYPDGWGGGVTTYRRFGDAPRPARVIVTASRPAKPAPVGTQVSVQVGPLDGPLAAPQYRLQLHSPQTITSAVDVPPAPFRIVVTVDPTFSPLEFGISDNRQLGAQLDFDYRKSNGTGGR